MFNIFRDFPKQKRVILEQIWCLRYHFNLGTKSINLKNASRQVYQTWRHPTCFPYLTCCGGKSPLQDDKLAAGCDLNAMMKSTNVYIKVFFSTTYPLGPTLHWWNVFNFFFRKITPSWKVEKWSCILQRWGLSEKPTIGVEWWGTFLGTSWSDTTNVMFSWTGLFKVKSWRGWDRTVCLFHKSLLTASFLG